MEYCFTPGERVQVEPGTRYTAAGPRWAYVEAVVRRSVQVRIDGRLHPVWVHKRLVSPCDIAPPALSLQESAGPC